MRDLSTLTDVITIVCCGDRSIGRNDITVASMIQMGELAKKEKTVCSQQTA